MSMLDRERKLKKEAYGMGWEDGTYTCCLIASLRSAEVALPAAAAAEFLPVSELRSILAIIYAQCNVFVGVFFVNGSLR